MSITGSGQWKIVPHLTIDPFSKGKMEETLKELLEEKEEALIHLTKNAASL